MKKYLVVPLIFPLAFYYFLRNSIKVIPDTWEDLMRRLRQLVEELEE